ncbi:Ig-like domain-containing protein [Bifidobacterium pseudocatenulatum]|uniref:Ig-like domain-containing protein n=1 Tax=Bifidobacterium pseudocatenulatum TaxID=28026 RepID=UPI003A520E0E
MHRPAGQVPQGFRQGRTGKSSEVTPDAESIAVKPDALAMRVGETARLEVSVLPAEASQEFVARIADPSIATIESEGL